MTRRMSRICVRSRGTRVRTNPHLALTAPKRRRLFGSTRAAAYLLVTWLLSSWASAAPLEPAEIFKRILSAPPVISEMVYQDKLPPVQNRPTPLDVGLTQSTNFVTCRLVWQPEAMFFETVPPRRAGGSAAPSGVGECFALWENQFYFLDPGQFAFVYRLVPQEAKPGAFPAPYHAALFKQHRACEPLNLGLNHLTPGAVRWDGDNFSAVGSADQKPMFVRGKITGWTNRIPNELQVQYSNDMGVANYRLKYEYARYEPPFFPSSITSYFQRQGREVEYRAYHILSIRTTNSPLPRAAFDPERYMETHGMRLRLMTNGTLYTQLPSGALIETPGALPKLKLTPQNYYANRYYYLAAGLSTVAMLAILARTKPREANPINLGDV